MHASQVIVFSGMWASQRAASTLTIVVSFKFAIVMAVGLNMLICNHVFSSSWQATREREIDMD
jgi:hypothetical protein